MSEELKNEIMDQEPEEKEGETKAEKFQRIGAYSINKVIDSLKSLEKLSNTSSYEYSEEMVEKMFSAIDGTLQEVKEKFVKKPKEEKKFTF